MSGIIGARVRRAIRQLATDADRELVTFSPDQHRTLDAGQSSTPANSRPIECRKPRGSRVMRALTVIALAMLWAGTSLGSVPESAARPGRLPAGIVPVHYSIVLLEHRT
jgi:hypothetical protein